MYREAAWTCQAAGPHSTLLNRRASMSGVAVDRAQPDGDQFEKQRPRCFSGLSPVTAIPLMPARRRTLRGYERCR
jgi:hypothetical protein